MYNRIITCQGKYQGGQLQALFEKLSENIFGSARQVFYPPEKAS